jgi:hypothetical protein
MQTFKHQFIDLEQLQEEITQYRRKKLGQYFRK